RVPPRSPAVDAGPGSVVPAVWEVGGEERDLPRRAAAPPGRPRPAHRGQDARASMAIKPGTPFAPYEELLPELDMVLVMTVEPGFGGQSFMADQMPKVAQVREAVRRHGGDIWVQVDGGVSARTIEQCAEAGADVFVAGSAVYGAEEAASAVEELRELARAHAR